MVKNKEITNKELSGAIENLATMVQNGFQHMDEKFMGKFDEVNKRLDGHDKRFDKLEDRFSGLENKTHEINARLMRVEKDVSEIKDNVNPQKFEGEMNNQDFENIRNKNRR